MQENAVKTAQTLVDLLTQGEKPRNGAIFLVGTWGVGKTHLWNNGVRDELVKRGYLPIYISLFGAKSVSEIRGRILAAYLTTKSDNWMKQPLKMLFGKDSNVKITVPSWLSKSVGGTGIEFDALEMVPLAKSVLCFDDLERLSSSADIDEVVGYVNYLTDKRGVRCLIVLDEDNLQPKHDGRFKVLKEKVGRRTIQLTPNLAELVPFVASGVATDMGYELPVQSSTILKNLILKKQISNLRTVDLIFYSASQCTKTLGSALPDDALAFLFAILLEYTAGRLRDWQFYDFNPFMVADKKDSPFSVRKKDDKEEEEPKDRKEQRCFLENYYDKPGTYRPYRYFYDFLKTGVPDKRMGAQELGTEDTPLPELERIIKKLEGIDLWFLTQSEMENVVKEIEQVLVRPDLELAQLLRLIRVYSTCQSVAPWLTIAIQPARIRTLLQSAASTCDDVDRFRDFVHFPDDRYIQSYRQIIAEVLAGEKVARDKTALLKGLALGDDAGVSQILRNRPQLKDLMADAQTLDPLSQLKKKDKRQWFMTVLGVIDALKEQSPETKLVGLRGLQKDLLEQQKHPTDKMDVGWLDTLLKKIGDLPQESANETPSDQDGS